MKHVFYIHSYVTYLVALGVIEHKQISDDDVLLLYARGGVKQDRFKYIDIDKNHNRLLGLDTYGQSFLYIKIYPLIRKLDKEITRFCKDNFFTGYLPSNNHFLLQLVATHKRCRQVHFIEEGLFSYNDSYYKKNWPFIGFYGALKRLLNTGNRNLPPQVYVEKATLYTLFDTSNYEGPVRKECVAPKLEDLPYDGPRLKDCSILMMNAFRDANKFVCDDVYAILQKFAVSENKKNRKLYIKHHPYSSLDMRRKIEQIFASNEVETEIIDDVNTELMLYHAKNICIYGFFSASMMYGALWQQKAYSFIDSFGTMSKDAMEYIKKSFFIPKIFYSHVSKINL